MAMTVFPEDIFTEQDELVLTARRGRDEPFLHRDPNTLVKFAEPTPNPLALRRQSR
jgi:hypothetical protein